MSSAQLKRIGELDVAEDIAFERRSWVVQRIAWTIMALILIAALLGLFGNGWLSKARASLAGGALEIEYNRFVRFQAPGELRARISPMSTEENQAGLWISHRYLNSIELKQITPAPEREITTNEGVIYLFATGNGGEPVEALFRFDVQEPGALEGDFALASAREVSGLHLMIKQWAYP